MLGEADIDLIFANGDFDEEAVFTITPGDESLSIRGWFTDGSDATNLYGVEIEAQKPTLICSTDAINQSGTVVGNKMPVTIRETEYTVQRIEKLGTGVSVIYLKT